MSQVQLLVCSISIPHEIASSHWHLEIHCIRLHLLQVFRDWGVRRVFNEQSMHAPTWSYDSYPLNEHVLFTFFHESPYTLKYVHLIVALQGSAFKLPSPVYVIEHAKEHAPYSSGTGICHQSLARCRRHVLPSRISPQVLATAPKRCPTFSSESIYAWICFFETHLISSLNDYCKRKEAPENAYLDSSRLVLLLL